MGKAIITNKIIYSTIPPILGLSAAWLMVKIIKNEKKIFNRKQELEAALRENSHKTRKTLIRGQ